MDKTGSISRRAFVEIAASTGAFLALGFLPISKSKNRIVNLLLQDPGPAIALNPFIFIGTDGRITILNHRPEMGQGTFQAIPMILAEELEVRMDQVTIAPSAADRSRYGDQMVVGSRSINSQFQLMRQMGATAREMLVQTAALNWGVRPDACEAVEGIVYHRPTGRQATYGSLVDAASRMSPPKNVKLKDPSRFKIIGKPVPRSDAPDKCNGSAQFGIDFHMPGMLYASIERSPVFLGTVVNIDDKASKKVPGVVAVFKTSREVWGHTREGVAVVANSIWAAMEGRKALKLEWDNRGLDQWDTARLKADYEQASSEPGVIFEDKGDLPSQLKKAPIKIEAAYHTPYQAHAPMEPMNATVYVQKDRCDFWGSTQNPNGVRSFLSQKTGLPEEKVEVHYTYMGGGFGRRSMTDVAEEAMDLSVKTGSPVKVIWTREDDISQGPFRAASYNVCRGALDNSGHLLALEHQVIVQDIRNQTGSDMKPTPAISGGITREYEIPHFRLGGILRKHYVPISYWRSVYHSTNCFAHESFIDECAHAAKKDPLDFRLSLLTNHAQFTGVLKAVQEKSGWNLPHEKDEAMGVAIVERSGAFVALVAAIKRVNGIIRPIKFTAAIDCGIPVNPDIIRAQTEGNIVMGYTAAINGLTLEKGAIVETNFDKYRMAMLSDIPEIEVIVMESKENPQGAGEGGLPPVAPALTNAVFQLTGKRIRELPFKLDQL